MEELVRAGHRTFKLYTTYRPAGLFSDAGRLEELFRRLGPLGVRFLLELASLGAFAYWGASLPARTMVRGVAAVGIPLAVALLWGVFISPKARIPTGHAGRAGLGLLVFLAAALALADRSHHVAAVAFAIVALGSSLLLYRLPQ